MVLAAMRETLIDYPQYSSCDRASVVQSQGAR
jgi:hypothetical protein